jgi:FAD/FMN-containing dehydrogenase/Fe-S oxidoreductase
MQSQSLPVLTSGDPLRALSAMDVGEVRLDRHNRQLYSTDASLYQVDPLAVVIPANLEQLQRLLQFASTHRLPILPRGGGTSLAGQCTGSAIIVDLSPNFRQITSIDIPNRRCTAQAGVVLDQLNRELADPWLYLATSQSLQAGSEGTPEGPDSTPQKSGPSGVPSDPAWQRRTRPGLFFAPDPATAAQACIGGCIGNNAAGARSIRYGRTSENLAGIEVMLIDGQKVWLGPGAGRRDPRALQLAGDVARIVGAHADLIRARFPKLIRRNAGYGLDLILQQLDAGVAIEDLDLTGLLCGSEGTLALILSADLKLHPLPIARGLAIASFASIDDAISAVVPILATHPSAIELLDDVVLDAARGNTECRRFLPLVPDHKGKPPAAALYVEYQTETADDTLAKHFGDLKNVIPDAPVLIHDQPAAMSAAWTLRKSAEALLHGMSATKKPVTFVEDNSVPVENLSRFVREFRRIVEAHGTSAAFYAHASVGVLHVRPMIDLRNAKGLEMMQSIAVQVADLARECCGVMSGEHGDGKARGPLLRQFYGPDLIEAFAQIKAVFDPLNLLNPGNIVNAGPVASITQNLRVQREHAAGEVQTYYDYHDQEGFISAVEMCNGAGFCRKTAGGTMCPSYRGTLDERHSTRGRGNALRLAITGQIAGNGRISRKTQSTVQAGSEGTPEGPDSFGNRSGPSGVPSDPAWGFASDPKPSWDDPDTMATLDLCLSCKACKTECPSNVDIARLKAEYTAQRFARDGTPLAAWVFGHIRIFNHLGSLMPGVSNWMLRQSIVRWIAQKLLHVSPKRKMPELGSSLFGWFNHRPQPAPTRPKVLLFGDCFTAYNEPQLGQSAVRVLERLGYQVLLSDMGCCGRSMMSVGLLKDAIASADRVIARLAPLLDDPALVGIVVCEPSCLAAMKDDWLQLKLSSALELRQKIAGLALLVEDFVEKRWEQHPNRPAEIRRTATPIVLHGHCHQKALWGDQTSSAILQRFGTNVQVLPSTCCGMAGAFGYAENKYDLSMKIGELSLFPPVRAAAEGTIITAPGTSCRHQIRDGTGKAAVHPIQVVDELL